jgi:hypothetical protein
MGDYKPSTACVATGVAVHKGSRRDLLRHGSVRVFVHQGPRVDGRTGSVRSVAASTASGLVCEGKKPTGFSAESAGIRRISPKGWRSVKTSPAARVNGGWVTRPMARRGWTEGFVWRRKGGGLWPGIPSSAAVANSARRAEDRGRSAARPGWPRPAKLCARGCANMRVHQVGSALTTPSGNYLDGDALAHGGCNAGELGLGRKDRQKGLAYPVWWTHARAWVHGRAGVREGPCVRTLTSRPRQRWQDVQADEKGENNIGEASGLHAVETATTPAKETSQPVTKAGITQCKRGGATAETRYGHSCPRLDGQASTEGRGSKSSPQWPRAKVQASVKKGGACSLAWKKTTVRCRGSRGSKGRMCAQLWRVRLLLTDGSDLHGGRRSLRRLPASFTSSPPLTSPAAWTGSKLLVG